MNKVSAIIPAYDSEDTIENAILSVINQSASPLIKEIVVVDDGSKDKTTEVVEGLIAKYKDTNIKLATIPNSGPSVARNTGIKIASGEWIAFLDSDDEWTRDKLKIQYSYIEKYPEIRFITSDTQFTQSTQGKSLEDNLRRYGVLSYFIKTRTPTPCVMIRKDAILEAGMFPVHMKHAEDQNLFMKVIARYRAHHVGLPLVKLADKAVYGDSGLSANIQDMHKGVVSNIKELKSNGMIGLTDAALLLVVECMKYKIREHNTRKQIKRMRH